MTRGEMLAFLKAHRNMKVLSQQIVAAPNGAKGGVEQVEIVTYSDVTTNGVRRIAERLSVELMHDVVTSVTKGAVQ